uniref:No apical meristem-associated C-terminal domain-containing protein n=1 Tax=Brassica oleracea var. oleracea TaxID=109376 RepID=A0A0D3AKW8_BRAOL
MWPFSGQQDMWPKANALWCLKEGMGLSTRNGGDASSFHFLSFLSFGFSVSTTTKAIPLALGGSSLVDSSAVPRRRLLSSRKEKGDVSIDGSARGKITAIWVESWWRYDDVSNASQKVVVCEEREAGHCKQRWHRINDLVCKFCGSYEAAKREKSSGCNENDGNSSKRKSDDGGETSNSKGAEPKRLAGVKASKASGKKNMVEEKALKEFESMWAIKQQDLAAKDKLSRMRLLESLLAKKEPLAEYEEALKKKIISDIMSGQCEKMEQWEWNNHGVSVVLRLVVLESSGLVVLVSRSKSVYWSWSLVVL